MKRQTGENNTMITSQTLLYTGIHNTGNSFTMNDLVAFNNEFWDGSEDTAIYELYSELRSGFVKDDEVVLKTYETKFGLFFQCPLIGLGCLNE